MTKAIRTTLTAVLLTLASANVLAIGMKSTSDIKEAIDQTISYLEKAESAFNQGETQQAVEMLMEAKQVQKSISSSNGQLSKIKAKATHKLGEARSRFNEGDTTNGGAAMKEALAGFKELKEKYHAMH